MIVREITERTEEILGMFDWFNDYHDTKCYCQSIKRNDIVESLDKGFDIYIKKINEERDARKLNKRNTKTD